MWVYHSPIGPMYIKKMDGSFCIWFDSIFYGGYRSPQAAADDVYTFSTGCSDWDLLFDKVPDCPTDLSEWEQC